MLRFAPFVVFFSLACPVHAQDSVPEGEGLYAFMERLLREFMTEAEPQLREFERGLTELEPEVNALLERMRDLTRYHPPEILPNGDILIRRRQAEGEDGPETAPEPSPDPDAPPLEL